MTERVVRDDRRGRIATLEGRLAILETVVGVDLDGPGPVGTDEPR